MRTSLVLALAFLAFLALTNPVVAEDLAQDQGEDTEWIEPSFVEDLAQAKLVTRAPPRPAPRPATRPATAPRAPTPANRAAPPANNAAGAKIAPPGGPLASSPARIVLPADIIALGRSLTRRPAAGPFNRACPGRAGTATGVMTRDQVTRMLMAAWKAFGATDAQAQANTARNLARMMDESSLCPNVIQAASTRDVNSGVSPAGGLLQFIAATYSHWHVNGAGLERNHFNPLSNIVAAVNAQVHGRRMSPARCHPRRVLSGGRGCGWSPDPSGRNPYR